MIASTIELKHCLSITGYRFFAWNVALLISYPLESYLAVISLPVFFPSNCSVYHSLSPKGACSGSTPLLAPSHCSLQYSPSSLQQCTSQHLGCSQKISRVVLKVVAFVVIAGTHYKFLWFVARVYMPGKKELCQLSTLVQPSQYADIITQKVSHNHRSIECSYHSQQQISL